MPQVSVMFPVQRSIDPAKVAEISAAVVAQPIKPAGLIHKSDEGGELKLFGLLKFDCASAIEVQRMVEALKPFGEVRVL
jgi:hypothetical protein